MDGSYLYKLPLMMIRWGVKRFGWKIVILGWAGSLVLIPVLTHYGF